MSTTLLWEQAVNRFLEVIARENPAVKFLRMVSCDAGGEDGYDHVALPTIMIYRAKEVGYGARRRVRSVR